MEGKAIFQKYQQGDWLFPRDIYSIFFWEITKFRLKACLKKKHIEKKMNWKHFFIFFLGFRISEFFWFRKAS